MYKSPVELIITEIEHKIVQEQEEEIYKAIIHYVPNVDKEELIRALKYDREQYDAGYKDGRADAPHLETEAVYKSGYEDGKPKWIPVAERMPDPYVHVIACRRNENGERRCGQEYVTLGNKWIYDNFFVNIARGSEVTHWMPLPEPPNGE